jgi:Tfp pilus assembly protein PilF
MELAVGTRLGPYEVVAVLGAGGMGEVYQARDTRLNRTVALKVLPDALAADVGLRARFEREAQAIATLNHPHICSIYDVGQEGSVQFFVMEHIQGESLAHRLRQGAIPLNEALTIAIQICDAVGTAHANGIVHRDLKPGNVMLDDSGSRGAVHAKLLDFGLARLTGKAPVAQGSTRRETLAEVSQPGEVLGTLNYMAPEQLRGQPADARADVWAIGCLLHEMVTGQDVRARKAIRPAALNRIIARCLVDDPEGRWSGAHELAGELRRVLGRRPFRHLIPAAAVAACVAAALTAALVLQRRTAVDTSTEAARAPLSMLIADFENRTGDSVFNGALEHAVAIGLEGASFVSIFPRQEALASARTITPTPQLSAETARLVAQREGVNAVVSGVISGGASGYVITVNIIDSVPGLTIASARQSVTTKDGVLAAMASIARELRVGVGDHTLSSETQLGGETFTTSSLDAARDYALAQELAAAGDEEQAIKHFAAALRHDPNFGRAYAGWALAAQRLGQTDQVHELIGKALNLRDRMTERERLRTEGVAAVISQDHHRSAETFRVLADKFPADNAALNNLAVSEFRLLEFERASATGRRAVLAAPSPRHYQNLALYSLYAGDRITAKEHAAKALSLSPRMALAYIPLAVDAALADNFTEAASVYERLARSGARGAAIATVGLSDLAAFRGDNADARQRARQAIGAEAKGNALAVAALHLIEAETAALGGETAIASRSARAALAADGSETVVFRAAEILARSGFPEDSRRYLDALAAKRNPAAQWYRRLLAARLAGGTDAGPVNELESALRTEPTMWLAYYGTGVMQLERGDAAAALRHFHWCVEHQGAAFSVYLDDLPTLRYLAQARYWRARALEAARDARAAAAYEEFVRGRLGTAEDVLALDAQRRLRALR